MTKRRARTPLQRAKIFEAHGGVCHICGGKIGVADEWDLEHIIALKISEDDSDENLAPAHKKCHQQKTKADRKIISKAERVRAKHQGAKPKSKFPGARGSPLKRKVNGTVVKREE